MVQLGKVVPDRLSQTTRVIDDMIQILCRTVAPMKVLGNICESEGWSLIYIDLFVLCTHHLLHALISLDGGGLLLRYFFIFVP